MGITKKISANLLKRIAHTTKERVKYKKVMKKEPRGVVRLAEQPQYEFKSPGFKKLEKQERGYLLSWK